MISNTTKKTVLCKTYETADTPLKKAKGLMFRDSLSSDHGMLFVFNRMFSSSMWMFGMRFPIDIVFMDSRKRVTRVVENARPLGLSWRTWRLYSPDSPAKYVIETVAGKSRETRTTVGDVMEF